MLKPVVRIVVALLAAGFVFAVTPANPGDLNGDNRVDVSDVFLIASCLGQSGTCLSGKADPNNDNLVNIYDFILVSKEWGRTYTPPVTGALVAAYNFNEDGGNTAADSSGNGNTATLSGVVWVSGKNSIGALCTGSSSMTVADSSSLDVTTGLTVEAWVRSNSGGSLSAVVAKDGSASSAYSLYSSSNSNIPTSFITIGGNQRSTTGTSALPVNSWAHIATTYDGSMMRFYVNGVQTGTFATTGTITANSLPLRMCASATAGQSLNAILDDVRIYNYARSQAEVQSDMNTAVGAAPAPPASVCGNGVVEGSEQCDGSNLNGATCVSRGFASGTLSCSGSCAFNTASCVAAPPDTTPPTVSISAPASGASIAATTTVTATASDNVAVQSVQFLINGNNLGSADASSPYSISLNPASYTNGAYTLTARATDTNTNIATSGGVSITIANPPDTAPPTATITSPTAGAVLSYGTTSTTLSVTTNEPATCRYGTSSTATYATMTLTMNGAGSQSHSISLSPLTNGGSYTYYVRCQDTALNAMTASQSLSFSVSSTQSSAVRAYHNSLEAGGDGSDSNVLLADDFNRGWWYKIDYDSTTNPTKTAGCGPTCAGNLPLTAGWAATIYDTIPSGGVGGISITGRGTPFAADHGVTDGGEGGNHMADHDLSRSVDHFWARFDFYLEPGYKFGWEKMLTVNPVGTGGIIWGGFKFSGDGGDTTTGMHWEDGRTSNRGFGSVTSGRWYSFQFHVDRPNHLLQIYLDDLGPSGTNLPANRAPTLVYQDLNYNWVPAAGSYTQFGNLWFENWANAGSTGRWYFTNVMVWENNGPIPIRASS